MSTLNKIIWSFIVFIILINTNLYAWMVQPSSEELRVSRENLQQDKATIKFVPAIDKIVETYATNKFTLAKLSFKVLRAKSKLTSTPIKTNRQRNILAILNYIDIKIKLALYKIYKNSYSYTK